MNSLAEDPLPSADRLKSSPVLRHLIPNKLDAAPKSTAENTVAQMHVPEGFKVELVTAEPDLNQPVAFTFDERGRIWVVEAYSYPQKQPAGKGLDKVVIFEDRDGDGKFETRKVFAEGLNLASAIELGYGGVWIGAAPELLFIPDRNHDDIPDGPAEVLLDGFGYQDTHECLNSFVWGPDGWLYGNQGVFNLAHIGKPDAPEKDRVELRSGVWRYHPLHHIFEVFAEGGSNQWGLDFDERGQLFMTHCRSYWGHGFTTHVVQGGKYWNQANDNYPPYIVANPPADFPEFRNFMLASARYGHGAGGAGVQGSDAIYGGHAHVGTMIYLGDNWPDEFRGHLFTHNLGGHQMNQEVNRRAGSGFETVSAGRDQLFCTDPKYVAVDLQYGPDGAVYIIDWYDQQHCHNPNPDRWDRSDGRIYRLQYEAGGAWKPVKVNLAAMDDAQLAELHTHKNEWFVRTARRLLAERSAERALAAPAVDGLIKMAASSKDPVQRLKALWTLQVTGNLPAEKVRGLFHDPDEFVRAWAVQFLSSSGPALVQNDVLSLARNDPSPVVRLYLASFMQRAPNALAWQIAENLLAHGEDKEDRNIPMLVWDGLAPLIAEDPARGMELAEKSLWPQLTAWIYWWECTGTGLDGVVRKLSNLRGDDLRRMMAGISMAVEKRGQISVPPAWSEVAPALYKNQDVRISRQAEDLAAVFGDHSMFPKLREAMMLPSNDIALRRHSFSVLAKAQDAESLPLFIRLLDDTVFRGQTIPLLARFENAEIPSALASRFAQFSAPEKAAALNALTSRASNAKALMRMVADGKFPRDQVTTYYVRQMQQLGDPALNELIVANWGKTKQTAEEALKEINRLDKVFSEAPLWAFDARAGAEHFQKLCAQCHKVGNIGNLIGPNLTGAGKHGGRYFLENIIDPNAVVGVDYQMTTLEIKGGEVASGILVQETPAAVVLKTPTEQITVDKFKILKRTTSENSMMPEGLLTPLNDRERIELLKFLTSK